MNKNLLYLLNSLGLTVIIIDEECYLSNEWRRAEGAMRHHYLRGKDLTELMAQYPHLTLSNDKSTTDSILSKIESLPVVEREFHYNYQEKVYLPLKRQ